MSLALFLWLLGCWFTYGFIRDKADPWFVRVAYLLGAAVCWPWLLGSALQRKLNRR